MRSIEAAHCLKMRVEHLNGFAFLNFKSLICESLYENMYHICCLHFLVGICHNSAQDQIQLCTNPCLLHIDLLYKPTSHEGSIQDIQAFTVLAFSQRILNTFPGLLKNVLTFHPRWLESRAWWPQLLRIGGKLSKIRTPENAITNVFKSIIIFFRNLVVCSICTLRAACEVWITSYLHMFLRGQSSGDLKS